MQLCLLNSDYTHLLLLHPRPPSPSLLPCVLIFIATEQPASSSNENNNENSRRLLFAVFYCKRRGANHIIHIYVCDHLFKTLIADHTCNYLPDHHTIGYICICEPNIRCLNSTNAHFSVLCSCSDSLLSPLDPPAPESILRRSISWHEYSQLTASLVRGRRRQRQRREEETDGCGALKKLSPTRREYI